ncbi:hypothetical protein [Salinibaculum rarum]|uniref:hypothetical protein n=1 Tax=Salinibaculum rarum TaxID=3058903 RepID=UPI00265F0B51|nr:hypothetical protein [Salinibaculum sp. KK48]
MPYYHTTTTDRGTSFTASNGGYYEAVNDHGCPELLTAAGEVIGFETADIPTIAGSHTPEASLFAAAFNHDTANTYYIYETSLEPDQDLSNCGFDFSIIEEVRWKHPDDTPVPFDHYATISLPPTAIDHVQDVYAGNPHDPDAAWATYIQYAFRAMIINDVPYPSDLNEQYDHPYADYFDDVETSPPDTPTPR